MTALVAQIPEAEGETASVPRPRASLIVSGVSHRSTALMSTWCTG